MMRYEMFAFYAIGHAMHQFQPNNVRFTSFRTDVMREREQSENRMWFHQICLDHVIVHKITPIPCLMRNTNKR